MNNPKKNLRLDSSNSSEFPDNSANSNNDIRYMNNYANCKNTALISLYVSILLSRSPSVKLNASDNSKILN